MSTSRAPEPAGQRQSRSEGQSEGQTAATWPEWARGWHELVSAPGRDTDTRMSEPYRFTRAIIAAHPDWGNKYIGRALGYDLDTCKNRGAYWRGRLAALGDLPEGAAFSVQRLPRDLRELLKEDPAAARGLACYNARKLPPIPRALLEELQATDSPEEVYQILCARARALEQAHVSIGQGITAAAAQAKQRIQQAQRPAKSAGEGGEEQPEGWGPIWLMGAAVLGALGAIALASRAEAQRLARELGQG